MVWLNTDKKVINSKPTQEVRGPTHRAGSHHVGCFCAFRRRWSAADGASFFLHNSYPPILKSFHH